MNVVIVEDEKLSAEHLTLLLKKIDSGIAVIKYTDTVKATIDAVEDGLKADLIFLDIHLADGNSFDIFKKIQTDIPIIFTTAFDNYAIQAFKQNSIDYLLKPIAFAELKFAIEKFKKQQLTANKQLIENITSAYRQLNKQYKNRFLVKTGQGIDTISTEEIHHFETRESLSFLVSNKGSRYAVDYTLDELEKILEPKDFFRINRKTILHIKSIQKVNSYFNGRFSIATKLLQGDSNVVSRERVSDFKAWLDS